MSRCVVCDGMLMPHLGVSTVDGQRVHDGCKATAVTRAYPHPCPQCSSSGRIVTAWDVKQECCSGGPPRFGGFGPFAGCEYCPKLQEVKTPSCSKKCDLCDGLGRLKTAPVPVMTQTGWKKGP
jgi:hypothetical protein